MKTWHRLVLALVVILALVVAGFVIWAQTPLGPMPEAESALDSDAQVTVATEPWLTFAPADGVPAVGLIIYPGGRVDPRSYAPVARKIAEAGYLVAIPPMPLNLAVIAPDRATEVVAAHPEIEQWALGGHSLGGAMAARYVYDHPDRVSGLALWASYPAESNPLKDLSLPVLSMYGTEDMGLDGIEASRELLPPQTQWVVLEGGNHAQFGSYGTQSGDGDAAISREEQQDRIVDETLEFLRGM